MIRIAEIQYAVAKHYGLQISDLRGPERAFRVSQPRLVAMYLSRRMTARSLQEIGNHFGGRDHTTVLSAHRKVAQRRDVDPVLSDDIKAIVRLIPSSVVTPAASTGARLAA